MPTVVISEFIDPAALEHFGEDYQIHNDANLVDAPERLAEVCSSADALIVRNRTQVSRELLDSAPHLKVIGRLGVGLDNIDMTACQDRGVTVCPATGANDVAVAEYVVAGALMLLRGAYQSSHRVLAGEWPRQALTGGEVSGRMLGLVGFGGIARQTAERAAALGMEVLAHDPFVAADDPAWSGLAERCEALSALLMRSDVVSLHVPYTETTHHLIDAQAMASMKPGAMLINAARGGVVDEAALARSLCDRHLGGAMLDVFEDEPLPAGSPLSDAPNLIVTPHIAGVTGESNRRVSDLTVRNVISVLRGTDRDHDV